MYRYQENIRNFLVASAHRVLTILLHEYFSHKSPFPKLSGVFPKFLTFCIRKQRIAMSNNFSLAQESLQKKNDQVSHAWSAYGIAIFREHARVRRSFSNFTGNLFRPTVPNGPFVTSHNLRVHSSVDRAWLKPRFESVNGFQEQTLERCLPSCLDNIGRPSPTLGTRMRLYSALQPHEITHKRIWKEGGCVHHLKLCQRRIKLHSQFERRNLFPLWYRKYFNLRDIFEKVELRKIRRSSVSSEQTIHITDELTL